ncbi:transposase [Pseudostreptobacillus hongkongensis]|uniref:transposase n=1 Tax=Pseudostreptobacillus hongkongensis TaxID=1162717 RepID=UPI0028D05059|nr:transposase [Pseudostreptobacillus hongkongensis]
MLNLVSVYSSQYSNVQYIKNITNKEIKTKIDPNPKLAKSSYYNWLDNKDKKTKRKIKEEILIKLIIKLYTKYKGTYGYNRMRFTVNKELKTNYSKNKIYRIMKELK